MGRVPAFSAVGENESLLAAKATSSAEDLVQRLLQLFARSSWHVIQCAFAEHLLLSEAGRSMVDVGDLSFAIHHQQHIGDRVSE